MQVSIHNTFSLFMKLPQKCSNSLRPEAASPCKDVENNMHVFTLWNHKSKPPKNNRRTSFLEAACRSFLNASALAVHLLRTLSLRKSPQQHHCRWGNGKSHETVEKMIECHQTYPMAPPTNPAATIPRRPKFILSRLPVTAKGESWIGIQLCTHEHSSQETESQLY